MCNIQIHYSTIQLLRLIIKIEIHTKLEGTLQLLEACGSIEISQQLKANQN